jgi:hypothetical protein
VAFWEKTRPEGDCLIWTGKQRWSRHGDYGLVWVGAGATPKYRGPHQVVLEKKLGRPLAPGLQVNHTCDHMRCVAEDHLYEGTQQQNIADMHARGRATKARGSRDGNAKLTEAQVYEIKLALVRGERQYVLAARYGVSFQLISEIARGKIWNHIILAS